MNHVNHYQLESTLGGLRCGTVDLRSKSGRRQRECQQQEQADSGKRPEARQEADQHSDDATDSAEQKIVQRQCVTKAKSQIVDDGAHGRCTQ